MTGRAVAHYEVLEKIGEGGMGVVYRARDTHPDRFIALKVLPPVKLADPERKRRFVQEARAASSLNHPNIIHIYDISSADGVDFIAMEYVAGKTLDHLIGRKGLRLNEGLKYAAQIADALARAHAAGIVHRDLKPSNIMVTEDGTVKVLDSGLAKLVEQVTNENQPTETLRMDQAPLTQEGAIVGTVAYVSPEQAEGRPLDGRSDIFAFGAVLYEMVTGNRAFTGGSRISTLSAILHQDPPRLAADGSQRDLEKIIFRCLRKDPNRRFQYAADVKVALDELREESESASSPIVAVAKPQTSRRRMIYAAVALLLVAIAGAWVWSRPRPNASMPVLTRVTSDSGLTLDPALSPDGKLFAFASDRGGEGNLDIWVQQISGGEAIRLTRDPADEHEPAFSPDGSRVAFRSEREGGGVYVVSALGGEARLIAPKGHDPRFSPEGASIAYWSGDYGADLQASGYIEPVSGGAARRIQPDFVSVRYPVWSSDGARLLFSGANELKPPGGGRTFPLDWWVTPVQGGPATRAGASAALLSQKLQVPFNGWAPSAWTADHHVLFASPLGDSSNLWRIPIAPRSFRIEGPAERLTTGSAQEDHPSVANGRVAFVNLNQTSGIWTLPVAANDGKVIGPLQRLTSGASRDVRPFVSANGATLVFLSDRSGNVDIWRKDLRTGAETGLPATPVFERWAVLSPDGSKVVYSLGGRQAAPQIFVLNMRGGVPENVCDDCARPESWSPDGKRIIFERRYATAPATSLGLLDLSTRQKSQILRTGRDLSSGRISPDGQWIGFHERTSPLTRQIWIARLRGMAEIPQGEWIPITDGATLDRVPSWSPNGALIYFSSTRDGFHCIWAQRLDPASKQPAGNPFPVQHFHQSRLGIRVQDMGLLGLSVARDKILLALGETTGNIWLMEYR